MQREEILNKIVENIDPVDEISEDTVIADSMDFDSLGLFNIVMFLKASGAELTLAQLAKCRTVGDLLDLCDKAFALKK